MCALVDLTMKRCYCFANRLTGITREGRSQPRTTNNEVHSQVAAAANVLRTDQACPPQKCTEVIISLCGPKQSLSFVLTEIRCNVGKLCDLSDAV